MHRLNENDVRDVSEMLDFLRTLQRQFHLAITLVHHTRKNNSPANQGQALRGSSDLYAWFDSCLYLRRKNDLIIMTTEHRAAPATPPVGLKLLDGQYPHLHVVAYNTKKSTNLCEDILREMKNAGQPLTRTRLRENLKTRNERLGTALVSLEKQSHITRTPAGWILADSQS
jgi:hypothetical protein